MIPPCSFNNTDNVPVKGASESSEEGQSDSKKDWEDGPVNRC